VRGMSPLRRALAGLAVVGVLVGIACFVMVADSDAPTAPLLEANLTILIGWSFIGTGLFAWDRRPSNLIGLLMVAVGFSWFLGEFRNTDIPAAAAIGFALNNLPIAILIHLLIVFPSGRARGRLDRFFIGYGYVAGGLIAFHLMQTQKARVSFVFKDVAASFLKRPEGDVHFSCEDGPLIQELMRRTLATGEREEATVHVTARVPSKLGDEPVATFTLTLSLKKR